MLVDAHVLQARRSGVCGRGHYAAVDLRGGRNREQDDHNHKRGHENRVVFLTAHCSSPFLPFVLLSGSFLLAPEIAAALSRAALCGRTGSPRCTIKSMARSIGI